MSNNIYDKEKLGKPVSYYASIRPSDYQAEIQAKIDSDKDFQRQQEERAKREKLGS